MTKTLLSVEEIQDALSALVDGADGRDLTDDEVSAVESLEADLAAAKAKRERSEAIRARVAEGRAVATKPLFVEPKTERDTLTDAFKAYLRTGQPNADIAELRNAQSEGSGAAGGYTVPPEMLQRLIDRMKAFGGLANVVQEITTSSGNTLEWPTLDDTGNVGEVVAEGGTFAGGADLVFGTAQLGAYRYATGGTGGAPLRISVELLQDSAFDVESLVIGKLGMRIARLQAQHLVSGTGVGQPLGITTGRTGVTTAVNNALTYKDLLGYVHSVDPAYREGARWAFNDASLQVIQGLLDANNRPILKGSTDGITGDPGGLTLLGYPVTIDQAFPTFTNNSPSINWGVFGELSEGYIVRRVRDVVVVANPWTRAANGQVEYSAWARMDATQQNVNAYSALTGHS